MSTVDISGNTITGNSAGVGGGLYVEGGGVLTIKNNTINSNSAGNGGGIYTDSVRGAVIKGNTVRNNSAADNGGGIYAFYSSVIVNHNDIVGNVTEGRWTSEGHFGGVAINMYGCPSGEPPSTMNWNNIYSNIPSDVYNRSGGVDATYNWWDTSNEGVIEERIYHWVDDSRLGLISFEPYLTSPSDITPPTTPMVTDQGDYTTSPTELHAAWSAEDPETGIAEYQYAIGTSAGATDVVDWTSAGTQAEVTVKDLGLVPGTTYYFTLKAKNEHEYWSEIGTSDGIAAIDTTLPEVGVDAMPDFVSSITTISGTASDDFELEKVKIVVSNTTDNTYWDGSHWAHTQTWLDASGTTSWSFTVPTLTDGESYEVKAKAIDTSGKESSEASVSFTYIPYNDAPNQPSSVSPSRLAAGTSLTPTLQSSAFSDLDAGNSHAASQWQRTTVSGDYSATVFDSGRDSAHLAQISIPSDVLDYETTYYWHVRHQDNQGRWSPYSEETSFVTASMQQVPSAQFSAAPTSGDVPLLVHFTDESTGNVTLWEWDFDSDGTVDSTEQSPSYTYASPGNYNVSLTVSGPGGSDTETKNAYMTVEGDSSGQDGDGDSEGDGGGSQDRNGDGLGCSCPGSEGRLSGAQLLIGFCMTGLCWGTAYWLARKAARRNKE